jgi:hypothetical protein
MKRILISLAILLPVVAVSLAGGAAPAQPPPKAGKLTMSADPTSITYGRATTITGKLRETPLRSNVPVTLEDNPAPYTRGFDIVEATTTDKNGDYTFSDVRPLLNTRYRTIATAALAESDALLVQVRIKVGLRLDDRTPRKGQRVRFYGTAAPDHDGREVFIQRRTRTGRWRTLARTVLKDAGTEFSQFSKRIRVRRDGSYRARVFHDSDHADGTSRRKRANVVGS